MKKNHGNSLDDWQTKYLKYKNKYLLEKSKKMIGGGDIKGPDDPGPNEPPQNQLMLFKADWCGHCQDFKSTWEEIKKNSDMNISFQEFDADKNKNEMKKYEIAGFPTLLLKTKNNVIEYNGNRDIASIKDFINSYN